MFDPRSYREACDHLTLDHERIEEMIVMTEQKKQTVRRPIRVAVIAAAMVAAMCVSAGAAQLPAVQDFIVTVRSALFVTGTNEDGSFVGVKLPEVTLDTQDGRTILTVDGEEVDVTDELAMNGEYTCHKDLGDSGFDVAVKADGSYTVTGYDADGNEVINYTADPLDPSADGKYSVTITGEDGAPVTQPDGAQGFTGTYTITTDDAPSTEIDG